MLQPARMGAWSGVLLGACLCVGIGQTRADPGLTWPEALYNPQPQVGDVLLALPCEGAMAFRAVATPAREAGYAVTGPFERADGTPYLLVGKYEVTGLQAQALAAQAAGRPCPKPQAALQAPQVGDWWDALEIADRYSLWLAANAEVLPSCADGASPCLPRVDAIPAYLRLPTDIEWEYAARGGLSVPAEQFGAPLYPMPEGLSAHAWYTPNAGGALQPIGGRAASPLGLHDLYGNAAEWVFGSSGTAARPPPPAALVVGGHAGSPEAELGADRRWALPPFAADPVACTGLRLLASVPLFTTPEKVRDAERRRSAHPGVPGEVQPPPPPVQFLANLRVATNVPAEVLVDGQVIGQARPGQPFETEAIEVGERQVAVRAEGYQAAAQTHRFRTRQWVAADFHLSAIAPPTPAVVESAPTPAAATASRTAAALPPLPEMIALPGGEFWMGSPDTEAGWDKDEGPQHKVRLAPFAVGKTEVTFAQYDAFAVLTGRAKPDDRGWGRGDRPVINVSWEDAVAYAAWLSKETGEKYRLPSEAEWEYAARAGTETPFWTGKCIHTDQANYDGNSDYSGCGAKTGVYRNQTVPVGSLPANPWGLHEVHGNVWEWVQDRYRFGGAPGDGTAWEGGGGAERVLRGGSWAGPPGNLRAATRNRFQASGQKDYIGFRLARTLAAAPPPSEAASAPKVAEVTAPTPRTPTVLAPKHPFEPEMIALPGGKFWMGSPDNEPERFKDEGPRHRVGIAPFAIGKTEVTFAQYDAFAQATGRSNPEDRGWGRGNRPVINVSWEDAVAYAAWLSKETGERYRLPSEAEWEYAARAGTETPFWTDTCIHTDQANYDGNYDYNGCGAKTGVYRGKTVPVGSLPANPWGLHEVHGNVWEWVQDRYHDSYAGAPTDGSVWEAGGSSARVIRGGSWFNRPRSLRAADRSGFGPGYRYGNLGFRLARTLSP